MCDKNNKMVLSVSVRRVCECEPVVVNLESFVYRLRLFFLFDGDSFLDLSSCPVFFPGHYTCLIR